MAWAIRAAFAIEITFVTISTLTGFTFPRLFTGLPLSRLLARLSLAGLLSGLLALLRGGKCGGRLGDCVLDSSGCRPQIALSWTQGS